MFTTYNILNIFSLAPMQGPGDFILAWVGLLMGILLFTSLLYGVLSRLLRERGEEQARVHQFLIVMGLGGGLGLFFYIRNFLFSLKINPFGDYYSILIDKNNINLGIVELLLLTSILGLVWGWIRIFQLLLIEDINQRFLLLIKIIPYLSGFMLTLFLACGWLFYSDIFPLWWFLWAFGLIYGMIIVFSIRDFQRAIQSGLSESQETEETLSPKIQSVMVAVMLISLIGITRTVTLAPYLLSITIPFSYIAVLLLGIWAVSMYMIPDKLFRAFKIFFRYSTPSARILHFAKYSRKFLLLWLLIAFILVSILSMSIFLEKGFSSPYKNLEKCEKNLTLTGEILEDYIKENNGFLPDSRSFYDYSWLKKVRGGSLSHILTCPSGGKYIYRKWRDNRQRPVFEIRCTCGRHKRAGISDTYPRYYRFNGNVREGRKTPAD